MKNFINCYSNGNVTVLGITIGDDFQHVMEIASLYDGKTDMLEIIIPSYKIMIICMFQYYINSTIINVSI